MRGEREKKRKVTPEVKKTEPITHSNKRCYWSPQRKTKNPPFFLYIRIQIPFLKIGPWRLGRGSLEGGVGVLGGPLPPPSKWLQLREIFLRGPKKK